MENINHIIETILASLKEHGYKDSTIVRYKRIYDSFLNYIIKYPNKEFTESIIDFVSTNYGINSFNVPTKKQRFALRCMNFVLDYHRTGYFSFVRTLSNSKLHQSFEGVHTIELIERFIQYRSDNYNISKKVCTQYRRNLYQFFEYLNSKDIHDISKVESKHVVEYIKFISVDANSTLYQKITTLRVFFSFLFDQKYLNQNLALSIPKINRNRRVHLPGALTTSQKDKVLASIDRNSSLGKRDYAIILIAAQLGLRAGDIRNLTFNSFDWNNNTISLIMEKTKKPIVLPITSDIGEAIIDYLQNGRPKSSEEYIFLTHIVPFNQLSTQAMSSIAHRHICFSKIEVNDGITSGMHLFRHTLASQLLSQGVELPAISEILGHSNTETTMVYTHIDVERLRGCALEVPPFSWEGDDFNG